MKKTVDYHYYLVVISGCCMIGVTLGLVGNLAGLFYNPIARDFSVGRGLVAFSTTATSLVQAMTGLLTPRILRRYPFKIVVAVGVFLTVSTTAALAALNSIIPMILLCAIRGIGTGLVGTVTGNLMINYWFNEKNSLATSIVMGFSGILGAALSPVLSGFISANGWRMGYLLLAAIMLIMFAPVMLMPVTLRPKQMKMVPYGGEREVRNISSVTENAAAIPALLFAVTLTYTVCAPSATALPQHYTGIAELYGLAQIGALMVSATLITNTLCKLLMGVLVEKLGSRKTVSLYACIVIAALVILIISRNPTLLITGAVALGASYSMGTVAISSMVRDIFGPENYSRVYPKLFFGITMSNSLFNTLSGTVYDVTGSYSLIMIVMISFEVIALTAVNYLYMRRK